MNRIDARYKEYAVHIRYTNILIIFYFPSTLYQFQNTSILITTSNFVYNHLLVKM